jgi:hypothetical protein
MSASTKSRTRAKLARFAARLGCADLSALDRETLEQFSMSELSKAASAAGLDVSPAAGRAELLARLGDELERPGRRERSGPRERAEVPWGYGFDRIRAMVVDPERMFVYWEITDDAIELARERLGAGGPDASIVLRVYDTTGRIFDGTNAHSHFDHEVARGDRQWFFHIGNPASEACVELGLRSRDGVFEKVARSGRVEFPRRGPLTPRPPRWLTVHSWDGQACLSSDPGSGTTGPGDAPPLDPGYPARPDGVATAHDGRWPADQGPWGPATARNGEWTREGSLETTRSRRWEGPARWSSWEAGPFTHDVDAPGPLTESFVGGMRVYRSGAKTHVVYGPWEVVIRGLEAYRRRSVLARWELHRSWISEEGREIRRSDLVEGDLMAGSSAFFAPGASERRWLAGSELRLGGASELLWMGASERRLGGASEREYLAASEWLMRGASERRIRGASEGRLGGASERRLGGASEIVPRSAGGSAYPRPDGESDVG